MPALQDLTCFKTYDIRGIVPNELNPDIAYNIGRAYAQAFSPNTVVIGNDIRLSGPEISRALSKGLRDSGVNIINIGECGTEEIYFAVPFFEADGGICITASHNPANYNGMKFVGKGSTPISADNGLLEIKRLAELGQFPYSLDKGNETQQDISDAYIAKLMTFVNVDKLNPLTIVANPGNGGAGAVINAIESRLPLSFKKLNFTPDGNFPNGVPNPLLPGNRQDTHDAVIKHQADFGIAWDGDFDRCFFFDENGRFIEGYYIVGMLAEAFLLKAPGKIVHDPRLTWNTQDLVEKAGGEAIQSKTGHAFIKERMRLEDAVYGGEMSAHHYFRDFAYCDSGMIPWLLVAEMVCRAGKSLSQLVDDRMKAYPCSGEINTKVADPTILLKDIEARYSVTANEIDHTDGLSMSFDDWRFNVRMSNTEPVVRLNVESRGDEALMRAKTDELLDMVSAG